MDVLFSFFPVIFGLAFFIIFVVFIFMFVSTIHKQMGTFNILKKVLRKAVSEMDMEVDESPRALNGCDSLLLPKILADFPDFDISLAKTYARDYIRECLQDHKSLVIHRIVISQYLTSSTQRTIVFQTAVAFTESGKKKQKRYDLHYCHLLSGDGDTIAANCPNCGGALGYGITVCPYCQSRIVNVLGNTWKFIDFIET